MASLATIPKTHLFSPKPSSNFTQIRSNFQPLIISINKKHIFDSKMVFGKSEMTKIPLRKAVVVGASSSTVVAEGKKKKKGGFVEEMRGVAMKLHTKEQAREGEKVAQSPEEKSPSKWEPSVEGYLRFLVDSKLVYDTLERIVSQAPVDYYAEFRNTGLERSEKLAKDLEWFKEQGYSIPEPSEPGVTYSKILEELAVKDPQAFICHFYNTYFAHSAGGRMIGRKVAEMILNKKELEFYKWDGDLSELLQNVREKLNKVAEVSGSCTYNVQITTGCSSVSYTKDQISLSFGDAYGTQVYVPRIDDPKSGTFEACSTDTFDISGPCTRDICYVYLYRKGRDGWNVGSVKISSKHTRTVTFNFKHWVPNDVWWGFNYCKGAFASPIL